MNSRSRLNYILFILLISIIMSPGAYGSTCNPGRALAKAEWAQFGKVKKVVAIEPFVNQSKTGEGGWLETGLAEILGGYLGTGKGVGVSKGLVRMFPPAPIIPDYIITGAFQKGANALRVYFKVSVSGNAIYQGSFSISPPTSGMVFTEMGKVARGIFESLKLGFDKKALAAEIGATANFSAYESYIKGLESMWKFDPNHTDVAHIWFNEAKKSDVYFQKPYLAKANIYGYLAIQAKSQGKPYSHYLERLEEVENDRRGFLRRLSPVAPSRPKVTKINLKAQVTNRFLNGNACYLAGIEAIRLGDPKKAKKELEKAVAFVPEDTVALRSLYNVYLKLGDSKKAQETLNKMSTDGMCY